MKIDWKNILLNVNGWHIFHGANCFQIVSRKHGRRFIAQAVNVANDHWFDLTHQRGLVPKILRHRILEFSPRLQKG